MGIELNLFLQSQRVAATTDVVWEHGAVCFVLLQGTLWYRITPKSSHLARDYFEWKRSMVRTWIAGEEFLGVAHYLGAQQSTPRLYLI